MQMRTVKLSQIGFGYFSCNPLNDQKGKYLLFKKNTSRWKAGCFARVRTRLSARDQLRACVKWDLVDVTFSYFPTSSASISASGRWIFSNFWWQLRPIKCVSIPIFLKKICRWEKKSKSKSGKVSFFFHLPNRILLNLHVLKIIPYNMYYRSLRIFHRPVLLITI